MTRGISFGLLGPLLLLNPGHAMTSQELAEFLWPAGPPPSARVTVQNYVKRLRQVLGDSDHSLLSTRSDGYLLRIPAGSLDTAQFEEMTARARQDLRAGRPAEAATGLRAALSLWRGRPLADVPCDDLVVRHAPRLEELRLQAVEDRIEADLHGGRQAEVISELRALIADDPLRERLHW